MGKRKRKRSESDTDEKAKKEEEDLKRHVVGIHSALLAPVRLRQRPPHPLAKSLSCFFFILGIAMIVIGYVRADRCKMRVIDRTSWTKPDVKGNLPKWIIYTGASYLVFGILIFATIGQLAHNLRRSDRALAGAFASFFTGFLGKVLLACGYFFAAFWTLIGVLWISVSSDFQAKSFSIGDPNYCDPLLWFLAKASTISFGICSILIVIALFARLYRFVINVDSTASELRRRRDESIAFQRRY